jgi:hypothetical protein
MCVYVCVCVCVCVCVKCVSTDVYEGVCRGGWSIYLCNRHPRPGLSVFPPVLEFGHIVCVCALQNPVIEIVLVFI